MASMDSGTPKALDEALAGIESCRACELGQTRINVVPGSGSASARVMLIGEAPGRNEDVKGEPFVGAAGKVLDQMLERIGLERDEVFITSILKCRPPRNRNPKADEIEACTPWLEKQLEIIDPDILVTMGNFATRFILHTKEPITELRGKVYDIDTYKVIPTYHPAAVIYDRSKTEVLEQDFDLIGSILREGTSADA